jgi:hypothetical protein
VSGGVDREAELSRSDEFSATSRGSSVAASAATSSEAGLPLPDPRVAFTTRTLSVTATATAPSGAFARKIDTLSRYEMKYLVATARVPDLMEEWSAYTQPDPHAEGEWGYPIYSVYWDSEDLRFFWEKVEGVKYRRKLRFRRYGDHPDVFLEIKQREDRTLQKRRVRWPADRMECVFGDGRVGVNWDEASSDPVATEAAIMIDRYRLRPRVSVKYRRRALFGAFDRGLRITFDGRVQYHTAHLSVRRAFDTGRYVIDPRVTVLEIKYDRRVPSWLTKAICRHGLKLVRMSKYCSAVDRHYFGGQNT